MSTTLRPEDLVIEPGRGEKTASDMMIIARSARLDGCFSIMEGEVRPRELLGFHTHTNEDQHMYIFEGTLHFEVGGADGIRFTAGPGSHVLKPRGTSHGFWNLGNTTARYVETSTRDGFERFVDSRADGFGAMVDGGATDLGMSFETGRSLDILREFELTGLAGANIQNPEELVRDPAFRRLMIEDETTRELFLYLGGAKFKEKVRALLGSLPFGN